jgi:hypothetical protein
MYKKIKNNDYELGSDFKNDDFDYVLSEYKSNKCYMVLLSDLLLILNIYMVCKRNNIKNYIIFIFILLIQFYKLILFYFTNYKCLNNINTNTNFKLFNNIIQIILIFCGLYMYTNQDNINE